MKPKQPHDGGTRAALYVRVAREDEGSANSVAAQQARVERFCREQGLEVIGVYADVGSGVNVKHPGLERALSDATEHRFDVLVAERLDRLSRGWRRVADVIERFRAAGVPVRTADGFCSASSEEASMQRIMDAVVEMESELRRARAREGRRRREAAKGWAGSSNVPTTDPIDPEEERDGAVDAER
jgi:DNA invertase Pin-like site-specific DNA recombinase